MNKHSFLTQGYCGAFIHSHCEGNADKVRVQFEDGRMFVMRSIRAAKKLIRDGGYKYRSYKGVRYVAKGNEAPRDFARCGHCGRAWDDNKPTSLTPAPSGRCPFEYMHRG